MKKQVNPLVVMGALALLAVIVAGWGFKAMQAPGYEPSPGVGGAPSVGSGYTGPGSTTAGSGAPAVSDPRGPNMPPPGVRPGDTSALKR
jgi:hypothetical protein